MRESELLAHIRDRSADVVGAIHAGEVLVGPGDDCAVVRTESGDLLLVGVDQVVEGRHFATGTSVDLIARKAVARSVSDIAAMGGRPSWGLTTGVLPKGWPEADTLFDRMAHWAKAFSCPLIGGDIASHGRSGDPLVLTVTVVGAPHPARGPVLRSGAEPGDVVGVTGALGGSLASGRHLTFEPRVELAHALCDRLGHDLHAMIDLSDGLGRDADRLARASGVVVEIDMARVPTNDEAGGWRQAAEDGEDYELLATAARPDADLVAIGRARGCGPGEPPGAIAIAPDGRRHDASAMGWDH